MKIHEDTANNVGYITVTDLQVSNKTNFHFYKNGVYSNQDVSKFYNSKFQQMQIIYTNTKIYQN